MMLVFILQYLNFDWSCEEVSRGTTSCLGESLYHFRLYYILFPLTSI